MCIGTDIGEGGVGCQLDIGLCCDVTIDIRPFIDLKTPGGSLVTQFHINVFGSTIGPLGSLVHVGHAVFSCIVGVGSTLAVIVGEGDAVIIDTEVFLVVWCSRPPLCGSRSGRTATHVGRLAVGNAPLLAADAAEVGRVVNLCLVEGEFLLQTCIRDAVAVSQFQLHRVGSPFGIVVTYFGKRGILRAIENPDGISSGGWSIVSHHLVSLLINGHLEVSTADRGFPIRIGSVETIGRASRQGHASEQSSYC